MLNLLSQNLVSSMAATGEGMFSNSILKTLIYCFLIACDIMSSGEVDSKAQNFT